MTTTADMTKALKDQLVPALREIGFKGSFPNFYRESDGFVALVNVQFNAMGERFCINLGFVDPDRRNLVSHCKAVPTSKLRVSMTGRLGEGGNALARTWRIGSQPLGDNRWSDSWFSYAAGQYGRDRSVQTADPVALARHCTELFTAEAEAWWQGRRAFAAQTKTNSHD